MGMRLTFGKAKTMSRKQMIDELWKHGNKGQMREYFKDADDDKALCGWLEQQSDERLHEIHQKVHPGHVEGGVAKAIMQKARIRQHTRASKTGKVATVKEHTDSRKNTAKNQPAKLSETKVNTWFERDRAHVELVDKRSGKTICEFWDEAVSEAVEDGFLDPKDYHGSIYEYAKENGFLDHPIEGEAQKKKPQWNWQKSVPLVFGKARIRQHTRATKTGKVATVKEHRDSRKDKQVSSHHYVYLDKKQFDDIKTAMEVSPSYGEFARVVAFVTGVKGGVSGISKADRETLRSAYKMKDSRFSLNVANDLARKYKEKQGKEKPEDNFEDVYDCQHLNSKQIERIEDAFGSAKDEVDFVRHVVDVLGVDSLPAKHSADLRDAFNTDDYEQIIAVADRVAGKMKKMRKGVTLTFGKSIVKQHQRTTKDGKVTTVKQYSDKRVKQNTALKKEESTRTAGAIHSDRVAKQQKEGHDRKNLTNKNTEEKPDSYGHVTRHNFRPGHKVRNPQGHEETVSHVEEDRVVTKESDRRNSWYHPTKVSHTDAGLQEENIKKRKAWEQEEREFHERSQAREKKKEQEVDNREADAEKSQEQVERFTRQSGAARVIESFAGVVKSGKTGRSNEETSDILTRAIDSALGIEDESNPSRDSKLQEIIEDYAVMLAPHVDKWKKYFLEREGLNKKDATDRIRDGVSFLLDHTEY